MQLIRRRAVTDPRVPAPAERRYVVAVLRLVVSSSGTILFGEAIDVETQRERRFRGWQGLAASLRALIASAPEAQDRDGRAISPGKG